MFGRQIAFAAIAAVVVGCSTDTPVPTALEVSAPLYAVGANSDINLGTHLTGDEEVFNGSPSPADSKAQGQAIFRVNDDGTVDFRLIASNIDNVIMAHIHCGGPTANRPAVIWLYPNVGTSGAPLPGGAGRQSGVLASGTFSTTGVVCSPVVGAPMPVLTAMRAGLTYVNVHTNDGVGAFNSGPGDFFGGEIRGQVDGDNHSH